MTVSGPDVSRLLGRTSQGRKTLKGLEIVIGLQIARLFQLLFLQRSVFHVVGVLEIQVIHRLILFRSSVAVAGPTAIAIRVRLVTTRAMLETLSAPRRFMTRTPIVFRPVVRTLTTGTRMTVPSWLMIMSSWLSRTEVTPTRSPRSGLSLMVITPWPPRLAWGSSRPASASRSRRS